MATSQFRFYTSADANGPGPIYGRSGSLINVLDACLINGYTDHPAAGWTKFDSGYTDVSGSVAAYQIASGSRCWMVVNDTAGYNATATGKEASVTGWETLTGLTSSWWNSSFTGSIGTGFNQFPLNGQMYYQGGRVIWRKSNTADATPRHWFMFADAYTMYLFLISGDAGNGSYGLYHTCIFGDIFSLKGQSDSGRCFIYGQNRENNGNWFWYANTYNDLWDVIFYANSSNILGYNSATVAQPGHFMARSISGFPGSTNVVKYGDISRTNINVPSWYDGNWYYLQCHYFTGAMPCPNSSDQSLYISPVLIGETSGMLRGRLRGWYFLQHPSSNFQDGQIIQGTGDYFGKTFRVVRYCGPLNNAFCIEISPTVETN